MNSERGLHPLHSDDPDMDLIEDVKAEPTEKPLRILLKPGVTAGDVRRMTESLRARGTGRHWIERIRGDVILWVSGADDKELVIREFTDEIQALGEH